MIQEIDQAALKKGPHWMDGPVFCFVFYVNLHTVRAKKYISFSEAKKPCSQQCIGKHYCSWCEPPFATKPIPPDRNSLVPVLANCVQHTGVGPFPCDFSPLPDFYSEQGEDQIAQRPGKNMGFCAVCACAARSVPLNIWITHFCSHIPLTETLSSWFDQWTHTHHQQLMRNNVTLTPCHFWSDKNFLW